MESFSQLAPAALDLIFFIFFTHHYPSAFPEFSVFEAKPMDDVSAEQGCPTSFTHSPSLSTQSSSEQSTVRSSCSTSSSSVNDSDATENSIASRVSRRRRRKRHSEETASSSLPSAVVVGTAFAANATILKRASSVISEFYGPEMFRKTYRMSHSCFDELLDTVRDLLERNYKGATEYRRETVPADIRLAITLRILAGASYCDLSVAYQVRETTIYDIFYSTVDALNESLRLKGFPRTQQALQEIANGFQTSRAEMNPLSGCVGALDGICIKIKKPSPGENPASFYSRKGFYDLPVLALCDSNYVFRYCSAVCTGATHDSLAYRVSGLKRDIDAGILGIIFYIVGDEAFVCSEELMTPFPNDIADADQDNFNFFLSSLRIHIEQAFGMLVSRWRILQNALQFSVRRCTDIICLLMKLHNFCIEQDGDASSYVQDLTEEEKEQLDQDVRQWLNLPNEVVDEFRERSQTRVTTRSRARQASSGRTKRDKLVAIVKEKNRRRPAPAPLAAPIR